MKIRNGFVSNSSSSSFICEICGEEGSGWDASPSDFNMCSCENGHVMCQDHLEEIESLSIEDKIEKLKKLAKQYGDEPPTEEEIEEYKEDEGSLDDMLNDYTEDEGEMSELLCPICQMKYFVDKELLLYLLKKNKIDKYFLMDEIRNEYKGDYKKFSKFIS